MGDLIDLSKARETALSVKSRGTAERPFCRHRHVDVSERSPKVACRDCGEPLDPHQVLLEFAREERRFQHIDADATRKREALKKSIAELEAEEKRIKARIRNARKKDG